MAAIPKYHRSRRPKGAFSHLGLQGSSIKVADLAPTLPLGYEALRHTRTNLCWTIIKYSASHQPLHARRYVVRTGYLRGGTILTSIRATRRPRGLGRYHEPMRFSPIPRRGSSTIASERPKRPSPPPSTALIKRIGNNNPRLLRVLEQRHDNHLRTNKTPVNKPQRHHHVRNRNLNSSRARSQSQRSLARSPNRHPLESQVSEKPSRPPSLEQRTFSPSLRHQGLPVRRSHLSP